MHVLILTGGTSNERDVSLKSANNIEQALVAAGYTTSLQDIADSTFDLQASLGGVDVVFPILHGEGGEDGQIQAKLEKKGVPFLGTNSEPSAIAFDKVAFKELLAEHGVLTPNWQIVDRQILRESGLLHNPYVIKPIRGGSSIDTFIVHNPSRQNLDHFDKAFEKYDKLLLEELIIGQEITVGVLGETALPVVVIIPPEGEEFDYENKYNGKTQELVEPHFLDKDVSHQAKQIAEKIHTLANLDHISRTDIIVSADGALYVLETNTIPGLTEQSLLPKAALASGMSSAQFAKKLVELALQ